MIEALIFGLLRTMIDALVFGLLGPIAGLLTWMTVLGGGLKDLPLDTLIIGLLFTYLAGLFPALITAAFDIFLDVRGAKGIPKYLLTGAFGYAAAYVVAFGGLMPLLIYQPRWGIIGAIPAVICSWIADKITTRVQENLRA
jgi:hypothetical protein